MISVNLSNRLIFIFSLLGLLISSFLLYEYEFSSSVICPTGRGCDIVRTSSYSSLFGISIPILGVAFYLTMAGLSVVHSHLLTKKMVHNLKLFLSISGVAFGVYLTYLEAFVIGAFCFWCVLSFIISILILLSVLLGRKKYEDRD